MREIRDKVEADWVNVMNFRAVIRKSIDIGSLIEVLLSHPNIAIVDRGAGLPQYPDSPNFFMVSAQDAYKLAQKDMLKAGSVMEVKDE